MRTVLMTMTAALAVFPAFAQKYEFALAGGGIKFYRGTGTEVPFQPLSTVALLTKTTEVQGLLSVGAGVKVALTHRMLFRVDVHDYLTPFPKKIITPALNSKASGWFNNIV